MSVPTSLFEPHSLNSNKNSTTANTQTCSLVTESTARCFRQLRFWYWASCSISYAPVSLATKRRMFVVFILLVEMKVKNMFKLILKRPACTNPSYLCLLFFNMAVKIVCYIETDVANVVFNTVSLWNNL